MKAKATEEGKGSGKGGRGRKTKKKNHSGLFGVHSSAPVQSGNWVHASGPALGDFSSPERVRAFLLTHRINPSEPKER